MKNNANLEHVVAITSSSRGSIIAREIFMQLKIPNNTAIIYVPHIEVRETYNLLKQLNIPVKPIKNNKTILMPGKIYISFDETNEYKNHHDYGKWNSEIKLNEHNQYFFQHKSIKSEMLKDDPIESYYIDYVDSAFREIGKAFRKRSIGIILNGTGDGGSKGIRYLKAVGGLTIAEKIILEKGDESPKPERPETWRMPLKAIETNKIDYVLTPDEIVSKLEELVHK